MEYNNERILITGGAGSLGKALIKYYQQNTKSELIVYSRDEGKHILLPDNVTKVIGDIRDRDRLDYVFYKYQPTVVVSAAALKRLDDIELHPDECIKTNILGVQNIAWVCDKHKVKIAAHVSSDKATNNQNFYGLSKFAGERLFTNYNFYSRRTIFLSVRYGNCIASRGSFIPDWINRLENNKEIPITDIKCSRFLFSLSDAVQFITSMIGIAEGGEVFVPIMNSFKIIDVIKALERITGETAKTTICGMRPGEKLAEDMLSETEIPLAKKIDGKNVVAIFPQYYTINPVKYSFCPYTGIRLNSDSCLVDDINQLVDLIQRGLKC